MRVPGEVQPAVEMWRHALEARLGGAIAGAWLCGSIALGAWDRRRSDVDFAVIVDGAIPRRALAAIHADVRRAHAIGARMEGVYVRAGELRAGAYVQRGRVRRGGGRLTAVARAEIAAGGVRIAGTRDAPAVSAREIGDEMRFNLDVYWRGRARRPWLFLADEMVDFAVPTLARIASTIETGRIVAKPEAIAWAVARMPRWTALFDEVRARRTTGARTMGRVARMREALRFVGAMRARSRE